MKIDLAKVDAQIKKLEELRRIASDPEMLSLLETVMVSNGLSPAQAPVPRRTAAETVRLINAATGGKKGQFQAAVRTAIQQYDKPFSGYMVARRMESEGYKFASSRPGIAVIDALKALMKKGVVKVHRLGSGSDATLFERTTVTN